MKYRIFKYDPGLLPYKKDINLRMESYTRKKNEILSFNPSLSDFANGHEYFGFHKTENGWYYREWAPAADEVYLTGDMVSWRRFDLKLEKKDGGVFEIFLPGTDSLYDGCRVKAIINHNGKFLERIPLYIRRVIQDSDTFVWTGVIEDKPQYVWKNVPFKPEKKGLCIYECHIGMAQEKEGMGTYSEFRENILPHIRDLGYNAIQIMAVMEHPYYGSFGYQVTSFFAASSRYGTSNELKELIDAAHGMGIAVLLDVVHSHAAKNTSEGINEFDGTPYQFFHEGPRGEHPAWGTKLFNYGKTEVLHFLLSNLKYWLCEFHFDGFRFDGVTSMIYRNHGLGIAFTDYGKYFSLNTDIEALTYLQLANDLIAEVNPDAITIAEDMSAMPGMCLPVKYGGIGFDYRLAMGQPDLWIKLIKELPDDKWNLWTIWSELTNRRPGEKYVAYSESHDQSLVGDKTLIFRLCDSAMYTDMSVFRQSDIIDRGMALLKLIRFITMTAGGEGYLNFMGNEFGHPEWVDFPREGNGWSHYYCRRQWHLLSDTTLRYRFLNEFEKEMVHFIRRKDILKKPAKALFVDSDCQVITYECAGYVFAINFSPVNSYEGYWLTVPSAGRYKTVMSTDEGRFGGFDRISLKYVYTAEPDADNNPKLRIYLPSRTALCMKKMPEIRKIRSSRGSQ
ncbi:MAG: alpha amylase C-terminal domain-containing protein [Clostridia bacterium]|nr:alpha amylase C-terminal domain-containing protein [Clostridia bacterium]